MLWYEKYRPSELTDYVWTNPDTRAELIKWISNPLGFPHLLITGPTGTGKTTIALIIRDMLELGADAKFIPASLRSGVDTIRDEIVGFCEAGGFSPMKLIIMDEADRLSRDAQEMMRNVMDRYKEDVRFIFTCNNLNKIIDPVQGRMWIVPIDALNEDEFIERLIDIAIAEDVDMDHEGTEARLQAIVKEYYPNLRTAISELQRSVIGGVLTDRANRISNREWSAQITSMFVNGEFSTTAAKTLVASLSPHEYTDVYRMLYENSHTLFSRQNEESALIEIAEGIFRHSQAGLPDITLVACLTKLSDIE